jgi:hypothetical protein
LKQYLSIQINSSIYDGHAIMSIRSSGKPDASRTAERIVHSLFANSERKPPEGTGLTISFLWRTPMSQVVYRGVPYDTEVRRQDQTQQQPQQYDAQYRGVKIVKEVEKK